jgi:cysteine protease ATG4
MFIEDWRFSKESTQLASQYYEILRLFDDRPSAPFSVHQIALVGSKYGKNVGEWFGPSTISQALGYLLSWKS